MGKATGIVRELDQLGRIVLPKEIRDLLGLQPEIPLEFFFDDATETIMIRKYKTQECLFCRSTEGLRMFKQQFVCLSCIDKAAQIPSKQKGRPKADSLERLIQIKQKYPEASQKQLAEIMGVSPGRISQLMKETRKKDA